MLGKKSSRRKFYKENNDPEEEGNQTTIEVKTCPYCGSKLLFIDDIENPVCGHCGKRLRNLGKEK